MVIVPAEVKLLPPIPSISEVDLLKHIELCGRICYKSEDKITENSHEKFVENIIKRGHEAVLEHASIIAQTDSIIAFRRVRKLDQDMEDRVPEYTSFLRYTEAGDPTISGNVRAWRSFMNTTRLYWGNIPEGLRTIVATYPRLFPEVGMRDFEHELWAKGVYFRITHPDDLKSPARRLVHVDRTAIFTCDRGVTHEIVRHRRASYCQESTRYCNYSREKFGEEITVIDPAALNLSDDAYKHWVTACLCAETAYFKMLNAGCTPQAARSVLPNSLKTELAMTSALSEWRHFLNLRCDPAAHPQMREVAGMLPAKFHVDEPDLFNDIEVRAE